MSVFVDGLNLPIGIATDRDGNIFITEELGTGPLLLRFSPTGQLTGQLQLAGLFSPIDEFGNTRLVFDDSTGLIYSLSQTGSIRLIDPNTGQISDFFNIRQVTTQSDRVYDIAQEGYVDISGLLNIPLATFSDIALLNRNNALEIYVSGFSSGNAFPFVMRLRIDSSGITSSEVLVTSTASATVNQSNAPGIAINSQGYGLTTLPIPASDPRFGNINVPVTFATDFEPQSNTGSFAPFVIRLANGETIGITSNGLTSDRAGNFYVASNSIGATGGGTSSSGAISVFSPTLNSVNFVSIGNQEFLASNDLAVSPDGSQIYATANNTLFGGVNLQGAILSFNASDIVNDGGTGNPESPPNSPSTSSGTTNIFRFQNTSVLGTYLYAGEQEAQNIRENFTNFDEEGFAFQVGIEPGDDLIPLYRFQSNITPGTYLFVGEDERRSINQTASNSFTEEGLAFYVFPAGSGLGETFYRFQNSSRPGTYLYASGAERENILVNNTNFIEEGAAFEVDI